MGALCASAAAHKMTWEVLMTQDEPRNPHVAGPEFADDALDLVRTAKHGNTAQGLALIGRGW